MNFRAILAAFFIIVFSAAANADSNPLDSAREAISSGKFDEADKILSSIKEGDVKDLNDLDFLRGSLAMARGDYNKAIECFRAVLTRNPSLNRVRLDLARAFFMNHDDEQAEYQFHIAEAAGLPPAVQANVDNILNEINHRKKWSVNASLGVEPSTNINQATDIQTVSLYGVPYQLSEAAQKKSGVGVVGTLSGSYQADMTDNTRMVIGGNTSDTDFIGHKDKSFDDNSVGAFIGPRFLVGDASELTIEATTSQRWYGGADYYSGAGGRVEGKTTLSPQWQLTGAVDVQQLSYVNAYNAYTGPVTTVSGAQIYGLNSISYLRMDEAVIHEQTNDVSYRDTQYFFGPSYYREFTEGYMINLGVNADLAYYAAPLAAFNVTRHDTTLNYQVGVSNRTINWFGFMPVVTYIHTNRYSDVPLYAFSSDRMIIGATQNF